MRILLTFLIIILCKSQYTFSQEQIYTGRVVDAETGEPVPYVSVSNKKGAKVFSDALGVFKVAGADTISISCIGYTSKSIHAATLPCIIKLEPYPTVLREVTVIPKESVIDITIRRLREGYKKNKKQKASYYAKISAMDYDMEEYIELLFNASSAVNLRDLVFITGRNLAKGDSIRFSDSHRLLGLAPMMYDSQFSNNILIPLNPISAYTKKTNLNEYYETEVEMKQSPEGEKLFCIKMYYKHVRGREARKAITGNLYIDAESYRLLSFEGNLLHYRLDVGGLNGLETYYADTRIRINYDYTKGFPEVQELFVRMKGGLMQIDINAVKVDDINAEGKKENKYRNLKRALQVAGYDKALWDSIKINQKQITLRMADSRKEEKDVQN